MLVWIIPARSILNHILISLVSYSVIYNSPYFFFSVFLIRYTSFPVLLPRSLGFKSGGGNRTLLRVLDLGTRAFLDAKKPTVKGVSFLRFLTFNLPQFLAELALPLPAVPHDWETGTVGTEFHVHWSKEKLVVFVSCGSGPTLRSLSTKASVKLTLLSPSGPGWVGCPGGPGSPGWPGIPGSPSIPWGPRGP